MSENSYFDCKRNRQAAPWNRSHNLMQELDSPRVQDLMQAVARLFDTGVAEQASFDRNHRVVQQDGHECGHQAALQDEGGII